MVKRKILVVTGQSNATTLADATSWEDEHPNLRLRSPLATAAQFASNVVAKEAFTMPGTFAGGPQAGRFGELTKGLWQTVDTAGKVVHAVRFLTNYNPTPSYLNAGTGATSSYPGVGQIVSSDSGVVLRTTVRFQYDPVGTVITRERTGSTHTIAAGWTVPTDVITLTQPMFPPPEPNERFYYTPTGGATSTTSQLRLIHQFGGLHDLGSLFDSAPSAIEASHHGSEIRRVNNSAGTAVAGRIVCKSRPGYPGAPVAFSKRSDILTINNSGAVDDPTDTITLPSNPFPVGAAIVFATAGWTIPGLTMGVTYYVVYSVGLTIRISATFGGATLPIGAIDTSVAGDIFVAWVWTSADVAENTTYFITRYAPELQQITISNWDPGTEELISSGHGLVLHERVRLSGTLPVEFSANTDYYVLASAGGSPARFRLSATPGGSPVAFALAGGTATLTRMEAYFHFYISATVGGAELVFNTDMASVRVLFQEAFRGSLTGMRVRALTGPNAGSSVPAGDVFFDIATSKAVVQLGTPFGAVPGAGDTYAIEPQPIGGKDVPFEKWGYFLPWCPFEGQGQHYGPVTVASGINESIGTPVVAEVATVWPNDVVRFYLNGTMTNKVNPGQRYYAVVANGTAAFLSETYDGLQINGTANVSPTGGLYATILRQEGKTNPYPPGFNYPNHYEALGQYQPFFGPTLLQAPKQTFATGLGVALAEHFGEPVYVIHWAVGATNIGHTDTPNGYASWSSTGDPNNLFAEFERQLDTAVLALEAEGNEGECIGIVYVQGEGDASFEDLANRYETNARALKAAMRQAIKDRGLFTRDAEEIPWIDPHCQTIPWQYAATVNAAKDRLIYLDRFSATFDQQDLERMSQLTGPNGLKFSISGDPIHYSGAGMTELERRAYAALLTIPASSLAGELEICNTALSQIGISKKITSFDDGSVEAEWCKTRYPEARDELLAARQFSFTLRRLQLLATDFPAPGTLHEEYDYCYLVPPDAFTSLRVMPPPNSTSAPVLSADPFDIQPALPDIYRIPFQIETNAYGDRLLFTNQENATLHYVSKVIDTRQYPPAFKAAVALNLATMLATTIVRGDQGDAMAERLRRRMNSYLGLASTMDAKQREPSTNHIPPHLFGR